jgi:hypothetical protein
MALNRALFTKQLNLGLNTVFGMEYDRYPEQWREIYSIEQSQKAFEEDVQMIGSELHQLKLKVLQFRMTQAEKASFLDTCMKLLLWRFQ